MGIVVSVLGALALGEGVVVWLLWSRWQSEKGRANTNDLLAGSYRSQLIQEYQERAELLRALQEHNKVEDANDKTRVETAPGLDDALSRINQL